MSCSDERSGMVIVTSCPSEFSEAFPAFYRGAELHYVFQDFDFQTRPTTMSAMEMLSSWECRVVRCAVDGVRTQKSQRLSLVSIFGGRHAEAEASRMPNIVQTIREEVCINIHVEWLEMEDFMVVYGNG